MVDFSKKYKEIISDLEKNIKNQEDLELAKQKVAEMAMIMLDSIDVVAALGERQMNMAAKVDYIQDSLKRIEKDLYIEEDDECESECGYCGDQMHDNDYEFEIECPYCSYEFVIGKDDDIKDEIVCPSCHKTIELDWDESCDGCCDSCGDHCDCEEDHCDCECETEKMQENDEIISVQEKEEEYKPEDEKNKQNDDDM